jgi:cobalt-zinc-cadmium efflux system membrane fusion protein
MTSSRKLACIALLMVLAGCEGATGRGDAPPAVAATADRCPHRLPPSLCPKCTPAVAAVFRSKGDWCEAHGFPESFCPVCRPDAAPPAVAAAPDWCAAHGLPESKCTRCNPGLIAPFKAAGDWCASHGFPESACPSCNPQPAPADLRPDPVEGRVVQLQRPELERAAGLRTVPAQQAEASATVACTARLEFHQDRVADVRAQVPGIVRKIRVPLGATVARGAPLFELESTQVGALQGALREARERARVAQANLQRSRTLQAKDIASDRRVELAERELADARSAAETAEATLRMAGAGPGAPAGQATLSAPIAGTVVRRPAVIGALATAKTPLATIADTSVMWALCDVAERDAPAVALGQALELSAGDEAPRVGRITWLSPEVDPKTRTVVARAELPNPDGRLRANQFARARIRVGAAGGLVVPRAALQRVGDAEVVFVRTAPGRYSPRRVERLRDGALVQVQGDLQVGDPVVVEGAVLLRTELLPGSLGAGCCGVEPPGGE